MAMNDVVVVVPKKPGPTKGGLEVKTRALHESGGGKKKPAPGKGPVGKGGPAKRPVT